MSADISGTLWKNSEKFQFCLILLKSEQGSAARLEEQDARSTKEVLLWQDLRF